MDEDVAITSCASCGKTLNVTVAPKDHTYNWDVVEEGIKVRYYFCCFEHLARWLPNVGMSYVERIAVRQLNVYPEKLPFRARTK